MDHKIIKIIVIIAFLISGFVSSAQNQIKGSLTDAKSGDPLMYVNCVLLQASDSAFAYGTTTDDQGRFVFKQVVDGNYLMRVSYVGYQTYWRSVAVKGNADLGRISLDKSTTVLSAVTVTAQKPLYAVDGEKNMYNTTEDPSIQNGTASDALQNAPGVEVDAEGNITLRGVSSVEIWINDRPSHMNEEALKQYIKTMPANAIDRIEVITNPSARYSSNGGVINIVTNKVIKRNDLLCIGIKGSTTPAIAPWLSYVWANEKIDFNIYLAANYSLQEARNHVKSTLLDDNSDTSRYQEYNTQNRMPYWGGYAGLNFNWRIDSMTTLATWAGAYPYWDRNTFYSDYTYYEYSGATRTDLGYLDTTRNNGFSHGAYAGAWYEHRFDNMGRKISATFNGNYWANSGYSDDARYYRSATMSDFKRHLEGDMWSGSGQLGVNYTHPLKHDITLEAGGEFGMSHDYDNEVLDSLLPSGGWNNMPYRSYMSQELTIEPNLYLTAQKRWGGFTAKVGLRYNNNFKHGVIEHHSLGDQARIDTLFSGLVPSIHLSYQTKNFESYSLSYTRRYSHDGTFYNYTLFRIYEDYSFSTGNPNLLMSYTHNLEAAFNKYIMKFGNVGINAYFRANTDEIGYMTAAAYDPVIGPYIVNCSYPVNIGSSHTEGIDANITYRPTGFLNVRFNASLFNYAYNYNDFSDSRVSYSFRLNLWAKLWNKLEVFANGSYSSPQLGLYSLTNAKKRFDFGFSSDFFDRKMSVYLNVSDIFGWSEWGNKITAPQYQTDKSHQYKTTYVGLGLTWRIGKMELESKARQGASDSPMGKS